MSKEKLIELRNNLDWIVNKVKNKEVSDSEMLLKLTSISPILIEARNWLDRQIDFHKQYAEKLIWSKTFGVRD